MEGTRAMHAPRARYITATGLIMLVFSMLTLSRPGVIHLSAAPADTAQATAATIPASKIDPSLPALTADGRRASFIILLAAQANLGAAYRSADPDARGWYVYQTLRDHAARIFSKTDSMRLSASN